MKSQEVIDESSGYSLQGSYTPDLVFSKLWLVHELERYLKSQNIKEIPVAYILGAWYSNLSTIMRKSNFPVGRIVDVEKTARYLPTAQKIQRAMNIDGVEYMIADANDLDYRQLQDPGLVINCSLTDMDGSAWFENIPPDTIVVLQARDQDPGHQFHSPEDIQKRFPLTEVVYQGSAELSDPETDYQRFMTIGRR